MIAGLGVDLVSVDRIKALYEKFGERFLRRIFTDGEIEYCMRMRNPFPHLAARFAAKEAFIKASGKRKELTLKEIEVIKDESGSPHIKANGVNQRALVSLSHERNYAIAYVVVIE